MSLVKSLQSFRGEARLETSQFQLLLLRIAGAHRRSDRNPYVQLCLSDSQSDSEPSNSTDHRLTSLQVGASAMKNNRAGSVRTPAGSYHGNRTTENRTAIPKPQNIRSSVLRTMEESSHCRRTRAGRNSSDRLEALIYPTSFQTT